MAAQGSLTPCHPYSCHETAGYSPSYLFASVHRCPLSWAARYVEKSLSPHALLARSHASPLSGAENLGRTGPLDASPSHGVVLSACAQGDLLRYSSIAGV